MMTLSQCARVAVSCLCWILPASIAMAATQATATTADTSLTPIELSLQDAVKMGLENNLDIKVARFTPQQRLEDVIFSEAAFDPNVGGSVFKSDNSQPSQNVFDIGAGGKLVSLDTKVNNYVIGFADPLRWGANYTAQLNMTRFESSSVNAVFPVTYTAQFDLAYNQSLLRNFGKKANETQIIIAQNNHQVGRSQYRDQILVSLQQIEDAYWELVFARQDLEVKKESLRLADQLLKLNRIKVEVGTLPPIEITQAEAEVAAREQGVIVAENAVADAEDVLRRTLNMPKGTDAWLRPIKTTDEPTFYEWPIDLDKELREAFDHRPDLEQARLDILNADTQLAFDRNQLKWDLNFRAAYTARGLSGDSDGITRQLATAFDDAGIDGVPGTGDTGEGDGLFEPAQPPGPTTPGGPGENLTLTPFQLTGPSNQDIDDALRLVRDRDFESWSVSLSLNVPIGNRAAQSSFVGSRLEKAQADARLERAKLNAEVEVRTAARAILTDKKRIEAAEKNVELQRKKVEAEQKKFENGMSTSFQVLDFQEDLTTALGDKNRALVDYRKSISTLEKAKGTLDKYLHVKIQ